MYVCMYRHTYIYLYVSYTHTYSDVESMIAPILALSAACSFCPPIKLVYRRVVDALRRTFALFNCQGKLSVVKKVLGEYQYVST